MRPAFRALRRLDRALAAVESALVAALLLCLVAGGAASVFLQAFGARSEALAAWLLLLPAAACGAAALWAARPSPGARASDPGARWGLLAAFLAVTFGLTQLGTALDLLLRAMVLWIGVLGASLATESHRHITIEVLYKVLPPAWKRVAALLVYAAAIAVLLVCLAVSWRYLQDTRQHGSALFTLSDGEFEFPRWWAQIILPAGFLIMAGRFLERFAEALLGLEKR